MQTKKFDFIVICTISAAGYLASVLLQLKPLSGAVLYLFIPSLYLMLREKKNFWKIFCGVVIFGVLVGFVFDFVATFNRAWEVTSLVLPYKFFGVLPLDEIIFWILMTLFILVFYEHFLDDEKNRRISKNLKWALLPFSVALAVLIVIYLVSPDLLKISYAYLAGGTVAVVFPFVLSLYKVRFLEKFLKLGAFFFFIWFFAELVCLKYNGWIFPGQYIGTLTIFGLSFPFEELFFWMMCYAATVVSYYEFFIDDKK